MNKTKINGKKKKTENKKPLKKINIKPKKTQTTLSKKTSFILSIIKKQKEITLPDSDIINKVNLFVNSLNKELQKSKIDATASIGGSVAKKTFVKDQFDADIFVRFGKTWKGKNISDTLENVLKKMKLNIIRVHGSRDYFQIRKEFTYEIVPVLKVDNYREAENVADMSPLHVYYFVKQASKNKNLRDEIRITKAFMKSSRVYGAESYIKGFSGHVVDLLLINYKSFFNLVSSAAKWKNEVIIDIEKHHIDAKMSLNTSKISGPLIIVDPIQKNRNAAAAVSAECFERFKESCKEFLKNPSEKFFLKQDFSEIINKKISENSSLKTIIINTAPLEGKRDVVGSKILKIKEFFERKLKDNDFQVLWSDWEFNEHNSRICFSFQNQKLSHVKIIKGPPANMKESASEFGKTHKKTFIKEDFIFAEEKREFLDVESLFSVLIKDEYVLQKCKKISFVNVQKA